MRIVLTNDDGIEAPGLLAARQALEKVGDVITVCDRLTFACVNAASAWAVCPSFFRASTSWALAAY